MTDNIINFPSKSDIDDEPIPVYHFLSELGERLVDHDNPPTNAIVFLTNDEGHLDIAVGNYMRFDQFMGIMAIAQQIMARRMAGE